MSKDIIEYLNWRFNYNYNKTNKEWIEAVQRYITHLEDTLNSIECSLELSGVEPKEIPDELAIKDALHIIELSKSFKVSVEELGDEWFIDMDKRMGLRP